ncbi:hypothetical protein [uncultured Flavobacterium sp.]|uniref:hypothetical protein n=1 Tax=uncultured Flavobacterium sp. TaxID=165435 RepID=UPI002931B45C|nr:hypothetical protein [uncultured Flavobacterium sp.]
MKIETTIEKNIHHFLFDLKKEVEGEKEAVLIIQKYIKEGEISDEEENILKTQLFDSFKIIGIGIPFLLIPGASILMPILIKVASKYNIELMPSAFNKTED